jgi:hypothetical protein
MINLAFLVDIAIFGMVLKENSCAHKDEWGSEELSNSYFSTEKVVPGT